MQHHADGIADQQQIAMRIEYLSDRRSIRRQAYDGLAALARTNLRCGYSRRINVTRHGLTLAARLRDLRRCTPAQSPLGTALLLGRAIGDEAARDRACDEHDLHQ